MIACLCLRNRLGINNLTREEIRRIQINVIDHNIVHEYHLFFFGVFRLMILKFDSLKINFEILKNVILYSINQELKFVSINNTFYKNLLIHSNLVIIGIKI